MFAAGAAYLGIEAFGQWLRRSRQDAKSAGAAGVTLALLVAVGIGLHNFGEGLAIGAAFVLGEAALGSLLIVGFTLHNTTEGLAIVAPLARDQAAGARPSLRTLVLLGLVGGAPTIAGAWLGGFAYSPIWSVIFLALGVGRDRPGDRADSVAGRRPAADPPISGIGTGDGGLGGRLRADVRNGDLAGMRTVRCENLVDGGADRRRRGRRDDDGGDLARWRSGRVREVSLVARDMAFYADGGSNGEPVLTPPGRTRCGLRDQQAPGMVHDLRSSTPSKLDARS